MEQERTDTLSGRAPGSVLASHRLSLNGVWQLQFGAQQMPARLMARPDVPPVFETVPAMVPGNVELDLVRAGRLPADLEFSQNVYLLLPYEMHQWWYSRPFDVPDIAALTNPVLVLKGVDTLATIWVNGTKLTSLANMVTPHEVPLTGALREGANEIVIGIDSPILEARDYPIEAGSMAHENNWESLNIRKAPHCYGWDIMPRVVSAGIWREVYIEARRETRFEDIYLATLAVNSDERSATLLARWSFADPNWSARTRNVTLVIFDPNTGSRLFERRIPALGHHGEFRETIAGVALWYPNGSGEARLYMVRLELTDEKGALLAEWQRPFGFRTVRLVRSDAVTKHGNGTFRFVVNGKETFVKGTNWVPLDAFHSRDLEHLDGTLKLVTDLNCNMIRCWGGNVYEDSALFDYCDRAGIMIWQDFALACALYPQTEYFHRTMREEAEAIVPHLRNHPSLVLWAGNNEIDMFYDRYEPETDPNQDDRISRIVLPEVCRRLDPHREYLPSSPYYSPEIWKRQLADPFLPEAHLWGPRDDFKGSFYAKSTAMFASEIGYHGCPARSALERMMAPDRLWPWQDNEDWLTHAIRPQPRSTIYNYRIPLVAHQIEVLFGEIPDNLDDFILASQISQAEALKFFIEMFRIRHEWRSGILWWNVRDGWPQISDAIVDYYGNKKLAYHAVKGVQQDVLVMAGEPDDDGHAIVAVNDTTGPVELDVTIELDGSRPLLSMRGVSVRAGGSTVIGNLPASQSSRIMHLKWIGDSLSGSNHYIAGPRPFDLQRLKQFYRTFFGEDVVGEQIATKH